MAKVKKPKGLVKSQSAAKAVPVVPSFDLSKIMILDQETSLDVSNSFKDYQTMSNDFRYQGYDLACALASEIAQATLGYNHSSDVLDSATDLEFRDYAGLGAQRARSASTYEDESDDYEEESDNSEIGYRHDHYDDVKENFKKKLTEAIGEGSLYDFESFKRLHAMAKKKGFEGDAKAFEVLLKQSPDFLRLCQNSTTNYTG